MRRCILKTTLLKGRYTIQGSTGYPITLVSSRIASLSRVYLPSSYPTKPQFRARVPTSRPDRRLPTLHLPYTRTRGSPPYPTRRPPTLRPTLHPTDASRARRGLRTDDHICRPTLQAPLPGRAPPALRPGCRVGPTLLSLPYSGQHRAPGSSAATTG
jgi:hypothetical protein